MPCPVKHPLRDDLPPGMPARMQTLPVDERGYPVPWFVAWPDGVHPEFRAMDGQKFVRAVQEHRCWVCGETLGRHKTFTIGPMCAVNRNTAEPPSHRECAEYSVKSCPFLSRPHMVRRESGMPEEVCNPAGGMIRRNPGVTLLWHTYTYKVYRTSADPAYGIVAGYLIEIGEPTGVDWYKEGRKATRDEVIESIRTGLPNLEKLAESDADKKFLQAQIVSAMRLVPA